MLKKWITNLLIKKRDNMRQDTLRLKWQKAELESLISKARSEQR